MFKVYAYYAAAVACGLLALALAIPALIGLVDVYVGIFSDTTTGLITWTDGRGFLAFLFALISVLPWIPVAIFLDQADNERNRIIKAVTKRLST